ncbi:MAG: ATP-binding protein [Thermodesulfobacteriota bacterium]
MTQAGGVNNGNGGGGGGGTVAPLTNVARLAAAVQQAIERPRHLPGMVTFYGPPGRGKSMAAAYAATKFAAVYVECKSSWTRRALLLAVLKELGVKEPRGTLYELTDAVSELLVLTRRPLIVDEFDHIVAKGAVEVVRDIYEGSQAPILLIGEELMPARLAKWERFDSRQLDFIEAAPPSLDDARHLARLYCPEVKIAEDLVAAIHGASAGSVRRLCIKLEHVRRECLAVGLAAIDRARWGTRSLTAGDPPARRRVG